MNYYSFFADWLISPNKSESSFMESFIFFIKLALSLSKASSFFFFIFGITEFKRLPKSSRDWVKNNPKQIIGIDMLT